VHLKDQTKRFRDEPFIIDYENLAAHSKAPGILKVGPPVP